jgi:hypothetical protein
MNLYKKFLLLIGFTIIASCSINPPKRNDPASNKPKSHVKKLKECVDSFMQDHGVSIEEAFSICEKIYRR